MRRAADELPRWPTSARSSRPTASSRRTTGVPEIELEPTEDVLSVASRAPARRTRCIVGFAAEHGDGRGRAGTGQARAQAAGRASWSTTSRAPEIGFEVRRERSHDPDAPTGRERHVPRAQEGTGRAAPSSMKWSDCARAREGTDGARADTRSPAQSLRPTPRWRGGSQANIANAVQVRRETLTHLMVALLAEGHVLIEDYPGVGKTALARALARSIDCQFARVQCTSDLLPADVVGHNVYDQREGRFEFRPGPGVRQRRARRRDQPGLAEDPVGPARVHAGATRDRRRPHARAGAPVPGAGHAEPDRVRGHLPAARGAGRPVHGQDLARLSHPAAPRRRCWPTTRPATGC